MTSAQLLSFPTKRIKTSRADKGLTSTDHIVQALSRAIIDHELQAGEKLKEQRIADQFGVSRTLVRQALYQLSQKHLIRIEQARGAFVATPSIKEAREVFGVRMALESAMVESLVANITAQKNQQARLRTHIKAEAVFANRSADASNRIELLGDFHVLMAELLDNDVLAQLLQDLISRCALITLLYQSKNAASHSHDEHVEILQAIVNKDASKAKKLMHSHLQSVLASLDLNDD
ncbi:MAG: GntR family transcriptional regulator [Polaromonas sp.]|nr:GntR family transcriptional regulator [Polaromonas sp.]